MRALQQLILRLLQTAQSQPQPLEQEKVELLTTSCSTRQLERATALQLQNRRGTGER